MSSKSINEAHTDAFYDIMTELCARFSHVHRAVRMQALLLGALAMADAASIEDRKGICVTEAEFLELCRRCFRKVRGE